MVVLHVAASAVVYAPLGSADWWAGNAWDAAMRWSVPVFVMLSGCLLLTPHNAAASWQAQGRRMARLLAPLLFGLAMLATMFGLYAVARRHGLAAGLYFYDYFSPGVIAMSLAAVHLLCRLQRPLFGRAISALARHTLGIYLLHPLVLDAIGRYRLLRPDALTQWAFIPLVAACTLLISLLFSALLARLPGLRGVV